MKGMALETVVQWIILSVVAMVVIGLVFTFSDDIKRAFKNIMNKDEQGVKTEIVESETFTTSQIKTYITACWSKTGEKYEGDVICYILKGDVSGVDGNTLKDALESPAEVDINKFDSSKTGTIIRFEDIGNIVYVESS
jgi:Flp pilus assembly pilin Flp